MSLRLLLALSGGLEILAGLPALITPIPRSTLRRGSLRPRASLPEGP